MYHIFADPAQIDGESSITITGPEVNHIRSVLRMKPGERLLVGDGVSANYLCALTAVSPDAVTAEILSVIRESTELPSRLYLFQGLPKGDKMELIIQKAVELGVYQIVPVETRRTVVRLDAKKAEDRVRRWNAIAESAAGQSGRVLVPRVAPLMSWEKALEYGKCLDVKLMPYENAKDMAATRRAVEQVKPGVSAGVLIGPEGGFEEAEVSDARKAGFVPVSLGSRILRTETAGMTMLSILMYRIETEKAAGDTGKETGTGAENGRA